MNRSLPFTLVFSAFFLLTGYSFAQGRKVPGELLFRLRSGVDVNEFMRSFAGDQARRAAFDISYERPAGRLLNMHVLRFDTASFEGDFLLDRLRRRREVVAAQYNYFLEFRGEKIPDDPFFERQWGISRIGVPKVWDITTGGRTFLGDEIVIAILDGGFDVDHVDVKRNVWINPGEIPDDGVDNDENGYVDDVAGWNFVDGNPVHPVSQHGQSVAGIAGAQGNNDRGVTGINWDVKMMYLTVEKVDEIVAAYEYVLEQRQRFNETGGREGALVVVTNASLGISKTFCEDQPVWGAMYDLLGAVGVLSTGGADNSAWDIDQVGDMPTTCTSEFLVTVLNVSEEDNRYQGSAWGSESIDMGAPGQNSFTTKPFDEYGYFCCNSAAVPHLSGTIALLFSLPCEGLAQDVLTQPEATALFMREVVLKGVEPLEDLEGITVTGGLLNVFNAMELIQAQCGGTSGPLDLLNLYPNPADEQLRVVYETPDFELYQIRVYNSLGQMIYRDEVIPARFSIKQYQLPTANWPIGMYYFSLTRGAERRVAPFIVQH
jgi:hypothetical protein